MISCFRKADKKPLEEARSSLPKQTNYVHLQKPLILYVNDRYNIKIEAIDPTNQRLSFLTHHLELMVPIPSDFILRDYQNKMLIQPLNPYSFRVDPHKQYLCTFEGNSYCLCWTLKNA